MKSAFVWTLSLAFLCCGCTAEAPETYITGEVLERHLDENGDLTSFVMREDGGEEHTFLISEETDIITSLDDDVMVHAFQHKDPGAVRATVRYELRDAHTACPALRVDLSETYDGETDYLADNTPVKLWHRGHHTYYRLENGIALLHTFHWMPFQAYEIPMLQEQYEISEDAAKAVLAYFEHTGMGCSVPAELEIAYEDYLQTAEPAAFFTRSFHQESQIISASAQVLYTQTLLEISVSDNDHRRESVGNAFDIQTGAPIPMEGVFSCPKEEIGARLLALADVDEPLRTEMEQAFSPEQILMQKDGLEIHFSEESLQHADTFLPYTDAVKTLLYDWAIPE